MELNFLVGDRIGRSDSGAARVVIVKLPGSEFALPGDPARDFDQTSGAEISPGKFLFPRPDHLHWFAGSLGKTRRFDRGIGRVLSTVARAGIGNDDPNPFGRNSQRLGQITLYSKRTLGTGPDR